MAIRVSEYLCLFSKGFSAKIPFLVCFLASTCVLLEVSWPMRGLGDVLLCQLITWYSNLRATLSIAFYPMILRAILDIIRICDFSHIYNQVPRQDLERGLVRVSNDRSLSYMFDVEETFGRLNFYLDHLDMDLSKYLSQAITYNMDACVFKTIGPPKKRYCNDFSLDEMVDWAEMEVEKPKGVETRTSTTEVDATDGVEARSSTTEVDVTDGVDATDKGKEKISQDATKVVETRRRTVETDSKTQYYSDDDSDYQPDKSVDYLSPGEEELIKLRNRMKANREAKAKAKDNLVSKMNEPNDENSMPADNVRGETFEEHDIYMNELLKSLNTADKDGITEDPFISVEKHVESPNQCTNAKKYALTEYEKTIGEHYAMVRSYGKAILDSNPGSTVKLGVTVNPDGKTYFDRDENNHIYPVAWAVVNVKNKDNWTWFLELLEQDLGSNRENGLTLMSDQHKGLMETVKDVMPNAEHRQCARHIYENFRKQYPGFWHVIPAGGNLFEVRPGSERFTVDEGKRTCSCEMWQFAVYS
ncbi:multidrug resistance-associated protein 5 [Tanacetum coccineum]